VTYPTHDSPLITIRHLVTQSSGLPRRAPFDYKPPDRDVPLNKLLGALRSVRLEYVPGTRQMYSNLGMGLAAVIVERTSGLSWREFVSRHILAPLQMNATAFDRSEVPPERLATGYVRDGVGWKPLAAHGRLGAVEVAGVLYSSVADLARFVRYQLSAWPPHDGPAGGPLRRASVRESQQRSYGSFGVNWAIDKDVVWQSGSTEAYRSTIMMLPQRGLALIMLTGCDDGHFEGLARDVWLLVSSNVNRKLFYPTQIALDRFLEFYQHPDATGMERIFSRHFLDALPDAFERAQRLRDETGACQLERVVTGGPLRAKVLLSCENEIMTLTFQVSAEPPHLIDGAVMKPAD
jgi:CubicO group peptidase (beta-lactamase class C family)